MSENYYSKFEDTELLNKTFEELNEAVPNNCRKFYTMSSYDIDHLINVFMGYREYVVNTYGTSKVEPFDIEKFSPASASRNSYDYGRELFEKDMKLAKKVKKIFKKANLNIKKDL